MGIFKKKKPEQPNKEYSAWCVLITILNRSELEQLVIIEDRWKQSGNNETGRFNIEQYLRVVQVRRSEV
jgi:hypothetical protein